MINEGKRVVGRDNKNTWVRGIDNLLFTTLRLDTIVYFVTSRNKMVIKIRPEFLGNVLQKSFLQKSFYPGSAFHILLPYKKVLIATKAIHFPLVFLLVCNISKYLNFISPSVAEIFLVSDSLIYKIDVETSLL